MRRHDAMALPFPAEKPGPCPCPIYERIGDLLKPCLMLQGSYGGVSLAEIENAFGVKRRTAERLRDAVRRALPQVEEVPTSDRVERWRLPPDTLTRAASIDVVELKGLVLAAERLRHDGLPGRADVLDELRLKLSARMTPRVQARVEPDLETLLQATGHAMRPGPRPRLQDGVLFGQRHDLVAFPVGRTWRRPALYGLGGILEASLGDAPFTRQPGFGLRAYAARSFEVFQEEPSEVVWRFPPKLAANARDHHFHPTEQKASLPDGSLELRFTAGGLKEMAWHLFTWGPDVEIVSPSALRDLYASMVRDTLGRLVSWFRSSVARFLDLVQQAEPLGAGQDVVGSFGPAERLRVGVGDVGVNVDRVLELPDAAVHAASELTLGGQRKEALDLVQPRRAGGREVHVPARPLQQPGFHRRRLVGAVVVSEIQRVCAA